MTTPLVYAVHSANLYGTERMALGTLAGFADEYSPILICPPGPLVAEAISMGVDVHVCASSKSLLGVLWRLLRDHRQLVFISTTIKQAVLLNSLNLLLRRSLAHLHLVHGGSSERASYGRKKYLNYMKLLLVGVSPFVRERLISHGVKPERIRIVGNFLTSGSRKGIRTRGPFTQKALQKGLVISRIIPFKRVDLLFDALELGQLADLSFTIYGRGGQLEALRQRAQTGDLNVSLPGLSSELGQQIADYDFMVHLCPEEPFGLVILEAMAAGLPVLVPDSGGVTFVVEHGQNGFIYKANDPVALSQALQQLINTPAAQLNQIVTKAAAGLDGRFSCGQQLDHYRALIAEAFS